MARPQKNNCDYFPHLTTMRNHKKIKAIRNKFGQLQGYAFWSMFLEYLTEQDGCEMEYSEIEIEMFSGELGISATEIRAMIDYCINIELLFVNEQKFIYSESLNDALLPVFEKRNRSKDVSKARKRRSNGEFIPKESDTLGINTTETPQVEDVSVAETPQSRVNKTIVKKNRVKKTKVDIGANKNLPDTVLFNEIKNIFLSEYKLIADQEYYFQAKDGAAIKTLINQVKFAYSAKGNENPTHEQIISGFEHVLKRAKSEKYIAEHFNLNLISSQFSNLIISKNGTIEKNKQLLAEYLSKIAASSQD